MKLLTTKQREQFSKGVPIRVKDEAEVTQLIKQLKGFYPELKWGHPDHDYTEELDFHRFELDKREDFPIILYTREEKLMYDDDQELEEVIEMEKKK